jgi:hypothetical protein
VRSTEEIHKINSETDKCEQFDENLLLGVSNSGQVVVRSKIDGYVHRPDELEDMPCMISLATVKESQFLAWKKESKLIL